MASMRMKLLCFVALMAMLVTGCIRTIDGRKEAGVPLVKDKLVRLYERPVLQVWAATKDTLNANGVVFSEDVMQSTVSARIDTRTVRVKVQELDPKTTRVTVQTRTKAGAADLDLAGTWKPGSLKDDGRRSGSEKGFRK